MLVSERSRRPNDCYAYFITGYSWQTVRIPHTIPKQPFPVPKNNQTPTNNEGVCYGHRRYPADRGGNRPRSERGSSHQAAARHLGQLSRQLRVVAIAAADGQRLEQSAEPAIHSADAGAARPVRQRASQKGFAHVGGAYEQEGTDGAPRRGNVGAVVADDVPERPHRTSWPAMHLRRRPMCHRI